MCPLKGKRFLITAGPTIEPIDPVRYISNYSTGSMGYELAKAAKRKGHRVILVSGPSPLNPPEGVRFIPVVTALDMKREVFRFFKSADCLIMAAAVSDFRPAVFSKKKLKKHRSRNRQLELKRNPDILAGLGRRKGGRILVGYSLETENPLKNAGKKLRSKNLDFIAVNKASKGSNPFGRGEKDVSIIERRGGITRIKKASKQKIARLFIDLIEARLGP